MVARCNQGTLIDEFGIDDEGIFGLEGCSAGVRKIDSDDPLGTADQFAGVAAQGGTIVYELPNGGWVAQLEDGSYVTFRPDSTSDSPAVTLNLVDSTQVQSQMIHFQIFTIPKKRRQNRCGVRDSVPESFRSGSPWRLEMRP